MEYTENVIMPEKHENLNKEKTSFGTSVIINAQNFLPPNLRAKMIEAKNLLKKTEEEIITYLSVSMIEQFYVKRIHNIEFNDDYTQIKVDITFSKE